MRGGRRSVIVQTVIRLTQNLKRLLSIVKQKSKSYRQSFCGVTALSHRAITET